MSPAASSLIPPLLGPLFHPLTKDDHMKTAWVRLMRGLAAMLLALSAAAGAARAQQATLSGRVVDLATDQPLPGARVNVTGTNLIAVANQEGLYTIRGVTSGTVELRVAFVGYAPQRRAIEVAAGDITVEEFALEAAPYQLEEVVTTVTGEQRNVELGNKPAVIRADEIVQEAPITNLSNLLSGRASGVQVLPSSGTTGAGTRIRVRGSSSVSLSNEPLLYVDGIRVDNEVESLAADAAVGGQTISRLNDINPEEIETIEILKGPSAATLYGTEAANGVIQITTKRGRAGSPRWNVYVEQGAVTEPNEYPTNFIGLAADGSPCALEDEAAGACTQDRLASFNVLENSRTTPFGTGYRQQYGANVSGGGEQTQYFLSGEYEGEQGVLRLPDFERTRLIEQFAYDEIPDEVETPNDLRRVSLRANLRSRVASALDLNIATGYVSSDVRLPQNDNNVLGLLPSGYFGFPDSTTEFFNNGYGFFLPGEIFQIRTTQGVERYTASGNLNWHPNSWLTGRAIVGLDATTRADRQFQPNGEGPDFIDQLQGFINDARREIFQYTVDLGATATFQLSPRLTSRTSAGTQYFKNTFNGTTATAQFLPAGPPSVTGGTLRDATEITSQTVTVGGYIEQQFGWNDRLFVTGGLRGDDNSSFGQDFDVVVYPKGSVSWIISQEPFFGRPDFLSELRLRGAIGASGVQPVDTAAIRFFSPVAISKDATDQNGVTLSNLGNTGLKPERSREIELGFDASFFDSRIGLEFTYYDKLTTDALVLVPVAPSVGANEARFQNIGSVRNSGVEVGINAAVLQGRTVAWDVALSGSYNRDNLRTLGPGVSPIILGDQRFVPNYPLGGYWAQPIESFSDANGDGIIAGSEVVVGDTAVFVGRSQPNKLFTLSTGVSLFDDRIRVVGLLDYRGGHKLQNLTDDFRCASPAGFNCRTLWDRTAPLEDQAAVAARTFSGTATTFGFIEDAEFLKLRELSVTFFAPDRWARLFRAERMSLTLTGRNLKTWTGYSGVDPEVNQEGQANFATLDFLTQPPVRYYTARLNLSF
jgi:TonB-linked SusC/RagA family outer membrane protein